MLRPTAGALCVLSLGFVTSTASASDRLVVFDGGERPGFVTALRIELGMSTEVIVEPPHAAELGRLDRIDASTRVLEERSAMLALWLSIEGDEAVITTVGPREGRAVVDVVRMPAEDSPDFDRALALKVSDLLDSFRIARDAALGQALVDPASRPPVEPPVEAPVEQTEPEPAPVSLLLDVSGRIALSNGSALVAGGGGVAFALRLRAGPLAMEPFADFGLFGPAELASGTRGDVEALELVPAAGARLIVDLSPLEVGAALSLGARVLLADGRTALGTEGSEVAAIPVVLLAALARLELFGGLFSSLSVGLEVAPVQQRFLLNGIPVADAGTIRFVTALGLGITTE
jgi:hypothetical protein